MPDATRRTAGRTRTPGEGDLQDADLAALVAAWPTLPDLIRTAIRALVGTVAAPLDRRGKAKKAKGRGKSGD